MSDFRARIKPGDVIDMHVHLVGIDENKGNYLSPSFRKTMINRFLETALGLLRTGDDELDKRYIDIINRHSTDKGAPDRLVLLGLDWVYDEHGEVDRERTHIVCGNDWVFEVCKGNDRLLPAASVNPQRKDAIDELERVVKEGAVLLKVLPNTQGFDPGLERYRPFWRRVGELNLPIVAHTGYEHALPAIDDSWGDPVRWIPALEEGCTVIAAHCAAAGRFHRIEYYNHFLGMLPRFDRLYGDISGFASPIRGTYLWPMLKSPRRYSRVLYGSDFPIPCVPMVYVKKLGFRTARALTQDENPIRRNLRLFTELGVGDEALQRAGHLLRGDLNSSGSSKAAS